jgi:methenyltetrahydrofolate cyclohydrolase
MAAGPRTELHNPAEGATVSASYLDQTLRGFLHSVAAREPAPGGGTAAAVMAATAAGLVAMAARYSAGRLPDAEDLAWQADGLRDRAGPLGDADAEAYQAVLAAYALPREPDPETRRAHIRVALRRAAEVPLEIGRVSADVARLAARLGASTNPNLTGDLHTALHLAVGAAGAAAELVRINTAAGKHSADLLEEARECISVTEQMADAVMRNTAQNEQPVPSDY